MVLNVYVADLLCDEIAAAYGRKRVDNNEERMKVVEEFEQLGYY